MLALPAPTRLNLEGFSHKQTFSQDFLRAGELPTTVFYRPALRHRVGEYEWETGEFYFEPLEAALQYHDVYVHVSGNTFQVFLACEPITQMPLYGCGNTFEEAALAAARTLLN